MSSPSQKMQEAQEILFQVFGHKDFRPLQKEVIERVFLKKNTLALMPTGAGKSLCYQIPAILGEDLSIVVSPLIALMQDQVQSLKKNGVSATFINSSLQKQEREKRQAEIAQGQYKILFCTPERFKKEEFWQALVPRKVNLLAVDEAHCISQWGHDFRPEYSRIGEVKKRLGDPTTLALTATATPDVQAEICKTLDISLDSIFDLGLDRPNLSLNVHSVHGFDEKVRSIVGLLYPFSGKGSKIIYCSLISSLYKLSDELNRVGISHLIYHGDLSPQERKRQQEFFIQSDEKLILATPAFGLGVDKSNVRLLIHFEVPNSLEAYFQEVGRAGRDGESSFCHLLYDADDVSIQIEFLKWANPDAGFIQATWNLIQSGGPGFEAEGIEYLRKKMNFYNTRDYRVETTLNLLNRWGCLEPAPNRLGYLAAEPPTLEMLAPYEEGVRLRNSQKKLLDMVRYCTSETGCRMLSVFEYFGRQGEACGICDLCQQQ